MNSTGKSEKASRCPQGRQSARRFSHVASEHCATDRSEVSGVRGRTSKRGFSRASASGRPSIGKEDAHGVPFVLQRPNEEPESKRDVRDRPEDNRVRCARVAIGFMNDSGRYEAARASKETTGAKRAMRTSSEPKNTRASAERTKNRTESNSSTRKRRHPPCGMRDATVFGPARVGTPGDELEPP